MSKGLLIAFLAFLLFGFPTLMAQTDELSGIVIGITTEGKKEALAGANLIWLGTTSGTVTDSEGRFVLKTLQGINTLIVSYVGFNSDTINPFLLNPLIIELKEGVMLQTAEVIHRQKSTVVSHGATLHTEKLGYGELTKAACCNLSESFETSPTVDVSFTDAITGTRQIRMLGLAGPYTLLTRENMPDIRGLASINGMEFIPGTWIDGIQLIKGAGSVVNGYESIAGQINTELQRFSTMPKFFVNLYWNNDRQWEANVQTKFLIAKNWQNILFVHAKYSDFLRDMNGDGFADKPITHRLIAMDRVEWKNDKNIHLELGTRLILSEQQGGQISFNKDQPIDTLHPWGMISDVTKADVWVKLGKVNSLQPWKSSAVQVMASTYKQEALYGLHKYSGLENSLYINMLNKGQIGSEKHEYTLGASFVYDDYSENLDTLSFMRTEIVPGVFCEYSFKPNPKVSLVGGMRLDYHNEYGFFPTPRMHFRWELFPRMVFRLSAGRGFRVANIFAEHMSMLASSRQIIIHSDNSGYGYGLSPETAWNYGANLTYTFEMNYREAVVGLAFYRTDFINQIVFDIDQKMNEVYFYNLQGESYANSFQFQFDYELFKRFDIRLAYRFYDVKTTFHNELKEVPLLAKHRGFLNLAYKTRNHWKFDATLNIVGQKRLPVQRYRTEPMNYSPAYLLINAQITKIIKEQIDLYMGVENLTNFRQESPIIGFDSPYSQGFDASLIWGPIWGQHLYLGLRYRFK